MPLGAEAANIPFFRGMTAAQRARLAVASSVRVFARGEVVFRDDDPSQAFGFVLRGRVKLTKTAHDGSSVILQTPGRGRLICAVAVCKAQPFCCTCLAMEDDTEILFVERGELLEVIGGNNAAALGFVREVCECNEASCQRIEVLGSKTIERRIAMLLLKLAEHSGTALPEGATRVPIALSRQELAALCGTTLETAIRVMSSLKRAGIVRTVARGFVIDDMDELRTRANP
jgi:CRP-like cAMP-binding protein